MKWASVPNSIRKRHVCNRLSTWEQGAQSQAAANGLLRAAFVAHTQALRLLYLQLQQHPNLSGRGRWKSSEEEWKQNQESAPAAMALALSCTMTTPMALAVTSLAKYAKDRD